MPDTNRARTILIREDTPLPSNLPIESEAFLPGWRAVRNLDGYELGRKIEEAKWYFFYLAGEIGAIALGREGLGTLRRAVKRILAKQEGQKFNSLEVTKIISIFATSNKALAWRLQRILPREYLPLQVEKWLKGNTRLWFQVLKNS